MFLRLCFFGMRRFRQPEKERGPAANERGSGAKGGGEITVRTVLEADQVFSARR